MEAALTSLMTLLSSAAAAGAGQVCGGRQQEAGVAPDVCEQASLQLNMVGCRTPPGVWPGPCVGSPACRGTEPCLCRCAALPAGPSGSPQDRRRINKTNDLKRYFKRETCFAVFHLNWLRTQRSHLLPYTISASDWRPVMM